MIPRGGIKKFILDFLNPSLFGSYVLIGAVSGIIFVACYFGYGCWFRVGGFVFMFVVPFVFALLLAVILAGRLQLLVWKHLIKQSPESERRMPLLEIILRSCLVACFIPILFANLGEKFAEARAQKTCSDCAPLITALEKGRRLTGTYPTNIVDLVRADSVLRRRYFFYYGEPSTNSVNWSVGKLIKADVGVFVTKNHFQLVVPIEQISPVSFSSFYVFSFSSEHPSWNKLLLHWSLLGAYVDEPSE